MKLIIRVFIAALVLIAVFVVGTFVGGQGLFSWLTGNVRTTTNITTVLERVQLMSQLTTTRRSYSNILTTERDLPPVLAGLYGDRLVLVAAGDVTAGTDLARITSEDITVTGDTLIIRLPAPQLQDCFFNEPASYVVSRDTGLFASPIPDLDENARALALNKFLSLALEDGILRDAQAQAELAIGEFVSVVVGSQYSEIRVVTQPTPGEPVLPPTCQQAN